MHQTGDNKRDLDSALVEKDEQIVKLQSLTTKLQLEIDVVQKTADEDKKRLETLHQSKLREQQRKHEEEINDLRLQLQRATSAEERTKADLNSEIQILSSKLNDERDQHTEAITELIAVKKELDQLKEERRSLTANLNIVQNLSDKVFILRDFSSSIYQSLFA